MVEWRSLALAYVDGLLILGRRQLIFNLPAGIPFSVRFVPSVIAPSDVAGGRGCKLCREISGIGPYHFSDLSFMAIFAKGENLFVIFF